MVTGIIGLLSVGAAAADSVDTLRKLHLLTEDDAGVHGSKIRLFMFDDRLELFSPRPPPNSVTVESMALRQATASRSSWRRA